jgi:hypothetical protein
MIRNCAVTMTLKVFFSIIKFGALLIGVVRVLGYWGIGVLRFLGKFEKTTIFQPIAVASFSVLKNVLAVSTGFTACQQKAVLNRASN